MKCIFLEVGGIIGFAHRIEIIMKISMKYLILPSFFFSGQLHAFRGWRPRGWLALWRGTPAWLTLPGNLRLNLFTIMHWRGKITNLKSNYVFYIRPGDGEIWLQSGQGEGSRRWPGEGDRGWAQPVRHWDQERRHRRAGTRHGRPQRGRCPGMTIYSQTRALQASTNCATSKFFQRWRCK